MKYSLKDQSIILDNIATEAVKSTYGLKRYEFKVKDLPQEDQPREKLLNSGPEALSTTELLAIVLNTGTKKEDVLTMSNRILKEYGDQALVHRTDAKKVSEDLDIPLIKAMQIVAVGELGRRYFQKRQGGLSVIRTPKDVFSYCSDMRDLPKEQLRGIYLNAHHRVIHDEVISIGTITSSIVHPREVFKPAIQYGAVGVVIAHNHPSGVLKPSQADIEITRQLSQVGEVMGITLLDHVIITKSGFISVDTESSRE